MKRKVWMLSFGGALALGVLVGGALAQQVELNNDPNIPLQIVSVSPQIGTNGTMFTGAKVTLQNSGNVPCVAFAVSLVFTFSNSQTHRVSMREDHSALGYAEPDPSSIAPGQNYVVGGPSGGPQGHIGAPTGSTIERIEARVDYVQMADGKTFGADLDNVGRQFRMERFGHAAERARLLKVYSSQGLQALLDQLKQK